MTERKRPSLFANAGEEKSDFPTVPRIAPRPPVDREALHAVAAEAGWTGGSKPASAGPKTLGRVKRSRPSKNATIQIRCTASERAAFEEIAQNFPTSSDALSAMLEAYKGPRG